MKPHEVRKPRDVMDASWDVFSEPIYEEDGLQDGSMVVINTDIWGPIMAMVRVGPYGDVTALGTDRPVGFHLAFVRGDGWVADSYFTVNSKTRAGQLNKEEVKPEEFESRLRDYMLFKLVESVQKECRENIKIAPHIPWDQNQQLITEAFSGFVEEAGKNNQKGARYMLMRLITYSARMIVENIDWDTIISNISKEDDDEHSDA